MTDKELQSTKHSYCHWQRTSSHSYCHFL